MVVEMRDDYLQTLRFPRVPTLHFRILTRGWESRCRRFLRRFFPTSPSSCKWQGKELITGELEKGSAHFREHGWVFIENIFDAEFHKELVANWPKNRYMEPPFDLYKSYNRGFNWVRGHKENIPYFELHPHLKSCFDYLQSTGFAGRISFFAGDGIDRKCYSFLTTTSVTGSNVAPHRDSIAEDKDAKGFLNMVFFVDGTGGENSGGLAILGDGTFDKVIFEPKNLKNTVLIYDSVAPFFHGFPPIQFGKRRFSINSQFSG